LFIRHQYSHARSQEELSGGKVIEDKDLLLAARWTSHWSLGGPVSSRNHSSSEIDKRAFVVIEDFAARKDKFYGGNPQDMFLLGNHQLSESAVIMIPEGTKEEEIQQGGVSGRLVKYNQNRKFENCRKLIKEMGGTDFEFVGEPLKNNWAARLEGSECDSKVLLAPFFENRFWGIHPESFLGRVNHVLTRLNFPCFCRAHSDDHRLIWAEGIDFHALGGRRIRELMCLYNALYPLLLEEAGQNRDFIAHQNSLVEERFAMIQDALPNMSEEGNGKYLMHEKRCEMEKEHCGPIILVVSIGISVNDWKRLDLFSKLLKCEPTESIFERTLKLLKHGDIDDA
jgi:hypothetical protein